MREVTTAIGNTCILGVFVCFHLLWLLFFFFFSFYGYVREKICSLESSREKALFLFRCMCNDLNITLILYVTAFVISTHTCPSVIFKCLYFLFKLTYWTGCKLFNCWGLTQQFVNHQIVIHSHSALPSGMREKTGEKTPRKCNLWAEIELFTKREKRRRIIIMNICMCVYIYIIYIYI